MRVSDVVLRLYVTPDSFEGTIRFYEGTQGIACELRFENKEKRISGAKIGRILLLCGADEDLAPVRDIGAIFYVDSLDAFVPWLQQNGARILHPPQATSFGRNMTVRNPDGLVAEYFEPPTA